MKNDEQSKRKSGVKTATNESSFKNLGHHTPPKANRGGNTSGMSSGSRSQANANMQPQSQASPSIDQRMQGIHLGLGGKQQ